MAAFFLGDTAINFSQNPMNSAAPALGVLARDLSRYRHGNTGIDCMHRVLKTCIVTTPAFRFVRPLLGFESFANGERITTDGEIEIRALCDDCTRLMPARQAIVGRAGVYLAQPMA